MHELIKTTNQGDERNGIPTASPFRRYELCAGSFHLEQQAKELGQEAHKKSAAADAGDRIHEWLAGQRTELEPVELETAQFLKERGDDQVTRIFGDVEIEVKVEQRLWMELGGKRVLSGRFDRMIRAGKVAVVQDWKSGHSEPDAAEQNSQLKVLAVLVALDDPTIEEVVAQVVSRSYGVTEARYSIAQLSEAYLEIIATLRAINDPHAAFNPSPEACRYCPAALICQALKDTILPLARVQYSEIPLEPARAAKLLDEVAVIKGHVAEIEKFYFQRLSDDPAFQIPGYALVPGVVRRDVTDWHLARQRLAEFIDEKDLQDAETYQLGDLEKALARKLKLKAKEAKARLNEILNGLIIEKQNQSSLRRVRGETKINELTNAINSQ